MALITDAAFSLLDLISDVEISEDIGRLSRVALTESTRRPILNAWALANGCDIPAEINQYNTLEEYFLRHPGARKLDDAPLVSPCDGLITSASPITGNLVEQIKGTTYDLTTFVGGGLPPNRKLSQFVIYLSPCDIHRFYAPTNLQISEVVHFPGRLRTVSPHYMATHNNVLSENERVVLRGTWEQGFFAFCAVGALNVGSIDINIVPPRTLDRHSRKSISVSAALKKGEEIGKFRLGSCIVLIFETNKSLIAPGRVTIGNSLLN